MKEQLLLFQEPFEERQERKILSLEEKYNTLRKSLHTRISILQKKINDLEYENEFLRAKICKENLFI